MERESFIGFPKLSYFLLFSFLYVNAHKNFSVSQRFLERLLTEAPVDHAIACWEW